jgi:hypothetical protein
MKSGGILPGSRTPILMACIHDESLESMGHGRMCFLYFKYCFISCCLQRLKYTVDLLIFRLLLLLRQFSYRKPAHFPCVLTHRPPPISFNNTDSLMVHATNSIDQVTTLHHHGLFFNSTSWMDGVLGVTQWCVPCSF